MPDGSWPIAITPPAPLWPGWDGAISLPPPLPPIVIGTNDWRPTAIVDAWGVCLADPSGELVGMDGDLGRGGPVANLQYATRADTRNL